MLWLHLRAVQWCWRGCMHELLGWQVERGRRFPVYCMCRRPVEQRGECGVHGVQDRALRQRDRC